MVQIKGAYKARTNIGFITKPDKRKNSIATQELRNLALYVPEI